MNPVFEIIVNETPQTVEILSEEIELVEIITAGPQGPQGPQGARGESNESYIIKPVQGNIGGQRFVTGNINGTVSYADATNLSHLGRVIGITLNAASDGDDVEVLIFGYVEFNGWDFDISAPVYLSTEGLVTQTQPTTGFSQIVGFAESPTKLFINLREPIILGD